MTGTNLVWLNRVIAGIPVLADFFSHNFDINRIERFRCLKVFAFCPIFRVAKTRNVCMNAVRWIRESIHTNWHNVV